MLVYLVSALVIADDSLNDRLPATARSRPGKRIIVALQGVLK
jgi:hypothetical protein